VARFFPDDVVDRVRSATDIVALVQETVPIKRSGATYKGLCPFHREKTPSFVVSPERQTFKCFGCGEGGDVFSFVMKMEHVDFPEALRILAERAGMALPSQYASQRNAEGHTRIYEVNAWAAEFYHRALLDGALGVAALGYLRSRGIADDTIERFHLGFAPSGWDALLKRGRKDGLSEECLAEAGLALRSEGQTEFYDRFRNRLMFPIRDSRNRVVGFGARALDDAEPKYLNSPETPVFSKGRVLYGIENARNALQEKRRAIIVEGYMDVIMAHQYGIPWTVGVLGTALTRDHVRFLRRYVDEGILIFDPDAAGQTSTERSIDAFMSEGLAVRTATLPDGLDPDEFLRRYGADALIRSVDSAVDGMTFRLRRALDAIPPDARDNPTRVAKALDDVLATVASIANPVAQSLEIRKIAQHTGLTELVLARRMEAVRRRDHDGDAVPAAPSRREPEQELLEALLTYPAMVGYVRKRLTPGLLERDDVRTLVERVFEMEDRGIRIAPEELLARTQEPGLRPLVEAMLSMEPKRVQSPEAWCDELLARLAARSHERAAAAAKSRVSRRSRADREEENRLLRASLEAARSAQEVMGTLKLREKP